MLVAAIAATTRRIRVGTAGVKLPHYSALKVAEQFKLAEAIAPGRIDLGLGRAPGSDGRTAFALNPNAREAADRFPNQVMDLLGWLGDGLPEGEAYPYTEAERARLDGIHAKALVGAPEQVKARLEALAAAHGAQEVA